MFQRGIGESSHIGIGILTPKEDYPSSLERILDGVESENDSL